MEAKALTVVTPRAFRSGETPHLKIATRNLETLTFTAYKLDAEAYFRKKHALRGRRGARHRPGRPRRRVDGRRPRLRQVQADRDDVRPEEARGAGRLRREGHRREDAPGDDAGPGQRPRRDRQGVARAGARLRAGHEDGQGPAGRPGARLRRRGRSSSRPKTGADGVAAAGLGQAARRRTPRSQYLVLDGDDVAGSGLGVPGQGRAGPVAARLPLHRPAGLSARPGGRSSAGWSARSRTASTPTCPGRSIGSRSPTAGAGSSSPAPSRSRTSARSTSASRSTTGRRSARTASGSTSRARATSRARSRSRRTSSRRSTWPSTCRRTVYYRGETIEGDVVARYQYGTPLAGRPIARAAARRPHARRARPTRRASITSSSRPRGSPRSRRCGSSAQLPQDNVAAAAAVMLAVRGFRIDLSTTRDVYLDGEIVPPRGHDARRPGRADRPGADRRGPEAGRAGRAGHRARGRARRRSTTDAKTGQGSRRAQGRGRARAASYVVRVAGTDRFGNPVVADRPLTISGKKDETKLRLLADRHDVQGRRGGRASSLHSRGAAGHGAADLGGRPHPLVQARPAEGGGQPARLGGRRRPVPELHADGRADGRHRVRRGAAGHPGRARPAGDGHADEAESSGPGGEVEVEVTTADQLGRPVAAEVSLALVDRSLLRLFDDRLPPIGPFFYDQTRTGAFATESTNTFRYAAGDACRWPRRSSRRRSGRPRRRPTPTIAAARSTQAESRSRSAMPGAAPAARRRRRSGGMAGVGRPGDGLPHGRQPPARWRRQAARGRMSSGAIGDAWRRPAIAPGGSRRGLAKDKLEDDRPRARLLARTARGFGGRGRGEAGRRRARGRPASGSSRRPTGTRASSPTRTARPASPSRPRRPSRSTASRPGASPAPTPSSARRRPSWPSARTSSST